MPAKYNCISRRLSDYEAILDLLHQHGDGVLCHVMVMKSTTRMSSDVIRNAFRWLVHYQPSLRVSVHTEVGIHGLTKRFVERKDIKDFEVCQVSLTDDKWDTVLEDECAKPFHPESGPLWKVVFMDVPSKTVMDMRSGQSIYTYVIMFKTSHVIADHVSVHNMLTKQLTSLLEQTRDLSGLDQFRTPLYMKPSVDQSFSPVSKKCNPVTLTVGKKKSKFPKVTSMKSEANLLGGSQDFSFLTDSNELNDRSSQTRIYVNALTKLETNHLLLFCRKHNVAPHEVLHIAAVYAFFLTTHAQRMPIDGSTVRICHWLSLRSIHSSSISREGDPLGMWLCPIFTKHKIPKGAPRASRFWSQVKKLTSSLKKEKEPWRHTFRDYHNIFNDVNKSATELSELPIPKAHVSVSYLDARTGADTCRKPTKPSGKFSSVRMRLSSANSTISSRRSRLSSESHSADTLTSTPKTRGSLVIDEYHVTSSVAPLSVSSLSLSVVLNSTSTSCTLSSDGTKVPRKFSESFLDVFCKVVTNMVTRTSSRHSSVVDKLPPYVRARIMTQAPGSSKI